MGTGGSRLAGTRGTGSGPLPARAGAALVAALVTALVVSLSTAGAPALAAAHRRPAAPAPIDELPDLSGTVTVDREGYAVGDTVTATVTVSNDGRVDATGITMTVPDPAGQQPTLEWVSVPEIRPFDLASGEGRTFTLSGRVRAGAGDDGWAMGSVRFMPVETDLKPDDNTVVVPARVPGARGSFNFSAGVAVDGTAHPAGTTVGVPGVAVTVTDDVTGTPYASGVTDATGRLTFTDIPAGFYQVTVGTVPEGLTFLGETCAAGAMRIVRNARMRLLCQLHNNRGAWTPPDGSGIPLVFDVSEPTGGTATTETPARATAPRPPVRREPTVAVSVAGVAVFLGAVLFAAVRRRRSRTVASERHPDPITPE